jgi:hypothetical protein
MRWLSSRYTHVPLAVASVLALVAAIGWLALERLELPWPLTSQAPSVVAIPPAPATEPEGAGPAAEPPAPEGDPGAALGRRAPVPPERFALESGPFASREAADRVETELNRLGHATVRFLREDVSRLFVVTATGFGSAEEARHAASELGRGTVVEDAGVAEIVLGRHPSLAEAVAAARPIRARGFEVRVREALAPSFVYHVRYGQFARRADAQAYREALAHRGIQSRVVKLR